MPNHYCLALLELNGIGFSTAAYETQKQVMQAKLTEIETKAYQLAGHSFSLTSPDDVAEVCESSDGRWSTFQKISSRCFSLQWGKNSHRKILYEEKTGQNWFVCANYELAACKVLCIFCLIVIIMISANFCRNKEGRNEVEMILLSLSDLAPHEAWDHLPVKQLLDYFGLMVQG